MLFWWRSPFWRGFMLISLLVVIGETIIVQVIVYTSETFKLVQRETPEILKRENKLSKDQTYKVFYVTGGDLNDNLFSYETIITDYSHCYSYCVTGVHKNGSWTLAYIYLSGKNGGMFQVYPPVPDSLAWVGHQRP